MKLRFFTLIVLLFTPFWLVATELNIFTEEMPPYNYKSKETGDANGFSVEIVKELLKRTNIKSVENIIHVYPSARAYQKIQKEKNVMFFLVARIKSREKMFKWVGPIAKRTIWLWKLKDRKDVVINSLEDAKKYTIGGVYEFSSSKYLQKLGFDVRFVPLIKQNWLKLFKHRIDLVSALRLDAIYYMNKLDKDFNQLEQVIKVDDRYDYYLALSKDIEDKTVNQLQEALDMMKKDGTFKKIKQAYLN